ncbi:HEAT repeat domain-containing protein [Natronomonas pharaonis]|uniref:HEAT repeat domain-containing protein n=1 Tax=Natronomonas pharaonis TaxID=2257 RepID=UPI0011D10544|nr:HEAT repeat domain-containing protein [Natronomonas pharaonis]
MTSEDTDADGTWLDRLEDSTFSADDDGLAYSVLEPPVDSSDIPELCRLLRGGDTPTVRQAAANALGRISTSSDGDEVEQALDELMGAVLRDDSEEVRGEAIDALYRYGSEHIDRLATRLAEAVRTRGSETPGAFFRRWLGSDVPQFRLVAAAAMATRADERVADELEAAFTDSDRRVQARALEAYGNVGDAAAVEPVRQALETDDPMVRRAAATALANIGTEEALEAMLPLAQATENRLRRLTVEQLHRLDRRQSAVVLVGALDDRSETVRRRAMVSLILLYTSSRPVEPDTVRDYLIKERNHEELVDLARLLSNIVADDGEGTSRESQTVKRHAVWLLGEIAGTLDDEEVHCWLADSLRTPDRAATEMAAAYLRQFEGEKLESKLRSMSRDADCSAETRTIASSVLERIKEDMAKDTEKHDVDYTYVRQPSDYTEKHGS